MTSVVMTTGDMVAVDLVPWGWRFVHEGRLYRRTEDYVVAGMEVERSGGRRWSFAMGLETGTWVRFAPETRVTLA